MARFAQLPLMLVGALANQTAHLGGATVQQNELFDQKYGNSESVLSPLEGDEGGVQVQTTQSREQWHLELFELSHPHFLQCDL